MKKIEFNSMTEFIAELDGYVYAICNGDGKYICDVLQDEYITLLDSGKLLNESEFIESFDVYGNKVDSDYVLRDNLNEEEIEKFKDEYGVDIVIK